MPLNDRRYYWVTCDEDGCIADTDADSDSAGQAEEDARRQGFLSDGKRWFCKDHATRLAK